MKSTLSSTITSLIPLMCLAADKGGKSGGVPEAKQPGTDVVAKLRTEYVAPVDAWDQIDSPEFGGQAEILTLEVGEIATDIEYTGANNNTIGDKEVRVHTGVTKEGNPVRLPIAASFLRALDQANVAQGDVIMIRRYEDQKKKAGVGKGQAMQIYGVKIKTRAAEQD